MFRINKDQLFLPEKAAYGLCDAPREWYLRLSRELTQSGMTCSMMDPCLWFAHRNSELFGVCGTYVDDLVGGGTEQFVRMLNKVRKQLPFGEVRSWDVRFTGSELRQSQTDHSITLSQERYVSDLEQVSTKHIGASETALGTQHTSLLRAAAGQWAWASNNSRPDQSFLASFLQGAQSEGTVEHLSQFSQSSQGDAERGH